ncbi:ABC transporter substrate-binding protein [Paenibacillus sp. IB182496]|uniref:ABC transporter substrate-binding protein n=1 Tax=Paenibacillus sabuli TaxID=2772509 RepID=A0A927GUE7_9BACL|nr:ABC transporter substrate-binding protein [Paenibacillus sabuli]MBD2848281.1 ABC transporter substrate-binding protein [Paenibacillus sabuli]
MKKAWLGVLCVVFLVGLLAACSNDNSGSNVNSNAGVNNNGTETTGNEEQPSEGASDGILRTGQGPADKFSAAWADYGGLFKTQVFRRLLMLDEQLQPVHYDLATAYTMSDDEKTYTFTLRDDVKWHDGEPFTPEDVKWSLAMAVQSAQINAVFSGAFGKIVGADALKAGEADELSGVTIDGNTLTIELTEPVGVFLLTMAQWPPYPKHLLESEDPATLHLASFWEKPIGNGPYMLTEVVPNNYAMLELYPDYYGTAPKVEKIMLQTISEDQLVTKAQAGELDYMPVMDLNQATEIVKSPDYEANPVDLLYVRFLMPNLVGQNATTDGNDKIADLRIRQALLHAIDRESLAGMLYPDQAEVLQTLVPTALPEYNEEAVVYDYNPEKAKQLLEEAGFDFNQTIRLQYYYTDQQTVDLIDTIKFFWEEIGVKVEASLMQGNLLELIYTKRDYDFLYAGLSAMAFEEAYGFFHSDGIGVQVVGASPDKWDPLVDELRRTSDPDDRMDVINRLQAMEAEFLTRMPLFSMKQYVIVNKSNLETAGIYGNEWTNYDRKLEEWSMK